MATDIPYKIILRADAYKCALQLQSKVKKFAIRKLVYVCVSMLFVFSSVERANAGLIEKIQFPALVSFDYAVEMLGLEYGIDPTFPELTAAGTVDDTGFEWTSSGIYNGLNYDWTTSGTYDLITDSINWSGSGTYNSRKWSFSGDVNWLSEELFEVRHRTSIEGLETLYTGDDLGAPSWDIGTATLDIATSSVEWEIVRSKTWWLGRKIFLDKINIKVKGGVVTENNLTTTGAKIKVGGDISIKGVKGNFEITGKGFAKTVKIEKVPEPSTLAILTLGLMGLASRRFKKLYR